MGSPGQKITTFSSKYSQPFIHKERASFFGYMDTRSSEKTGHAVCGTPETVRQQRDESYESRPATTKRSGNP